MFFLQSAVEQIIALEAGGEIPQTSPGGRLRTSPSFPPPVSTSGFLPIPSALGAISENSESAPERDVTATTTLPQPLPPALELETLRRERHLLLQHIHNLESVNAESNVRMGHLENEVFHMQQQHNVGEAGSGKVPLSASTGAKDENETLQKQKVVTGDGGIVHSVQIRTGGSGDLKGNVNNSPSSSSTSTEPGHVNIEIKKRYSHPSPRTGGISVVNLRGSAENLHVNKGDGRPRTGSIGKHPPRAPKVISNRIVMPHAATVAKDKRSSPQLNRVLSNKSLNPKSRSVENLQLVSSGSMLGLKNANSEMNMTHPRLQYQQHPHPPPSASAAGKYQQRLRGSKSEMHVNRIGERDKIDVTAEALDGILHSMPAELARGLKAQQVRPNRERIRNVLKMDNVIDLQRQLLTTVMENEVCPSCVHVIEI